MIKYQPFTYVHLHKTGGSHIKAILNNLFDGEQIGDKHASATLTQLNGNNYFVSSIRNPWDWYLSLWTYGVQGNGVLMRKTTLEKQRHLSNTFKSIPKNPKKYVSRFVRDAYYRTSKNIPSWRYLYRSCDDVQLFRDWLKRIHNPANSRFLGEGYGRTVLPDFYGFMTYRYLRLTNLNFKKYKRNKALCNYSNLIQFDLVNCYIDYFIRQESLEEDLCYILEKFIPVTETERDVIFDLRKTNASKREYDLTEYYDDESIDLVMNRDSLIIKKFNYSPPY